MAKRLFVKDLLKEFADPSLKEIVEKTIEDGAPIPQKQYSF